MPNLVRDRVTRQIILMPGKVYCRWQDNRGDLCFHNTQFSGPSALRHHYEKGHGKRTVKRKSDSNGVTYQQLLNRWYRDIMARLRPSWIPNPNTRNPTPDDNARESSNT